MWGSQVGKHLSLPATSLDSKWHLPLTDPSDFPEDDAELGGMPKTPVTLFCLDFERALPVVEEMKSCVERRTLGAAEIKHGTLKGAPKKDERHLDFRSEALSLVAFVNFS